MSGRFTLITDEALLDRFESFELAGEPRWTVNNRLVGLRDLPLRVSRRQAC